MTEKQSDLEKALIIYKESRNAFEELNNQIRELQQAFNECTKAMKTASTYLQRALNEEENGGNIHKDCRYYNSEMDYCSNYMMGRYTGLAFEVSRHKKCIDDMRKDGDVE